MPADFLSLSPEILERVANNLSKIDAITFSVTCKAIHIPATKSLFRSLTVKVWKTQCFGLNTSHAAQLTRMLKVESTNTGLHAQHLARGTFVRYLRIQYDRSRQDGDRPYKIGEDGEMDREDLDILMRKISDACDTGEGIPQDQFSFFLDTVTALLDVCPSLTSLAFVDCDLLPFQSRGALRSTLIRASLSKLERSTVGLEALKYIAFGSARLTGAWVVDLLPSVLHKLASLEVHFETTFHEIPGPIALPPTTVSNLSSITMTSPGYEAEQLVMTWFDRICRLSPKIAQVNLKGCKITSSLITTVCSPSVLPLLACLYLDEVREFELNRAALSALRSAPKLTHLRMEIFDDDPNVGFVAYLPINLENLELTGIGYEDHKDAVRLLQLARTLALENQLPAGFRYFEYDTSASAPYDSEDDDSSDLDEHNSECSDLAEDDHKGTGHHEREEYEKESRGASECSALGEGKDDTGGGHVLDTASSKAELTRRITKKAQKKAQREAQRKTERKQKRQEVARTVKRNIRKACRAFMQAIQEQNRAFELHWFHDTWVTLHSRHQGRSASSADMFRDPHNADTLSSGIS